MCVLCILWLWDITGREKFFLGLLWDGWFTAPKHCCTAWGHAGNWANAWLVLGRWRSACWRGGGIFGKFLGLAVYCRLVPTFLASQKGRLFMMLDLQLSPDITGMGAPRSMIIKMWRSGQKSSAAGKWFESVTAMGVPPAILLIQPEGFGILMATLQILSELWVLCPEFDHFEGQNPPVSLIFMGFTPNMFFHLCLHLCLEYEANMLTFDPFFPWWSSAESANGLKPELCRRGAKFAQRSGFHTPPIWSGTASRFWALWGFF